MENLANLRHAQGKSFFMQEFKLHVTGDAQSDCSLHWMHINSWYCKIVVKKLTLTILT